MGKSLLFNVFKPGSAANLAYISRDSLVQQLIKYMNSDGIQIVIYGESQSGKTTLIENTYNKVFKNGIRVVCESKMSVQSIINKAIEDLGVIYNEETVNENSTEKEGGFRVGLLEWLGVSINKKYGKKNTKKNKPVIPYQPDIYNLTKALKELNTCLIIDDFHRLPENEREYLSELLKIFSEEESQIVIIGIAESAKELIEKNKELAGRLSECFVPVLQSEEIEAIIKKGASCLNVNFSNEIIEIITSLSMNNGVNCHRICLDICYNKGILEKSLNPTSLNRNDLRETLLKETYVSRRGEFMDRRDKVIQKNSNEKIQFLYFQIFTVIFSLQTTNIDPIYIEKEITAYKPVGNYDFSEIYRNMLDELKSTTYSCLLELVEEEGGALLEVVNGDKIFKIKDMLLLGFVYLTYEEKLKEHWESYEIEFPIYRNTSIGKVLKLIGSDFKEL